jgi:plastocyanin
MKVPLKRHWHLFHMFTKLRRCRLTLAQWTLLSITTAMFFLSAASTGCPTNGYGLAVVPNFGSSVTGNSSSGNDQLPPDTSSSGGSQVAVPALPSGKSSPSGSPIADSTPSSKNSFSGSSSTGSTVKVMMVTDNNGFAFRPQTVTVKKGTTVIWVNKTNIAHTVTSGRPGHPLKTPLNSSDVTQGNSFSYTFNTAGTFQYFCIYHSEQVGTITVK